MHETIEVLSEDALRLWCKAYKHIYSDASINSNTISPSSISYELEAVAHLNKGHSPDLLRWDLVQMLFEQAWLIYEGYAPGQVETCRLKGFKIKYKHNTPYGFIARACSD